MDHNKQEYWTSPLARVMGVGIQQHERWQNVIYSLCKGYKNVQNTMVLLILHFVSQKHQAHYIEHLRYGESL